MLEVKWLQRVSQRKQLGPDPTGNEEPQEAFRREMIWADLHSRQATLAKVPNNFKGIRFNPRLCQSQGKEGENALSSQAHAFQFSSLSGQVYLISMKINPHFTLLTKIVKKGKQTNKQTESSFG